MYSAQFITLETTDAPDLRTGWVRYRVTGAPHNNLPVLFDVPPRPAGQSGAWPPLCVYRRVSPSTYQRRQWKEALRHGDKAIVACTIANKRSLARRIRDSNQLSYRWHSKFIRYCLSVKKAADDADERETDKFFEQWVKIHSDAKSGEPTCAGNAPMQGIMSTEAEREAVHTWTAVADTEVHSAQEVGMQRNATLSVSQIQDRK